MKIKVPANASILTTKGFESVTKCIGDAVCIPYADTISAETLSFGHYKLTYETIPVYTTPCDAPKNVVNFYPPESDMPCSLDQHTLMYGVMIPTHEHYHRLFSEAFLVSPLEICNTPNIEAVVIKRLKESGQFTVYKEGHELFKDALETILSYFISFFSLITGGTPVHIEKTDTQVNVIIQTSLNELWVSECVKLFTLFKRKQWKTEYVKYDRTSKVIIKSLDTTNYSVKELQIFCTLAHRIGMTLYPVGNRLYTSLWGIIPEGLGNAPFVDRSKVKLSKRLAYKTVSKFNKELNFEFKLTHEYWKWLWLSTRFFYEDNSYTGVISMLLDSSENLLPLSYKLTEHDNMLVYDRCPFVIFSKHFNLYTENEWVELDIPEPKILQIRYSNWHILPIAVTN